MCNILFQFLSQCNILFKLECINFLTYLTFGYRFPCRADNAAYPHDGRADKRRYRHDRRADSQCHHTQWFILPVIKNSI